MQSGNPYVDIGLALFSMFGGGSDSYSELNQAAPTPQGGPQAPPGQAPFGPPPVDPLIAMIEQLSRTPTMENIAGGVAKTTAPPPGATAGIDAGPPLETPGQKEEKGPPTSRAGTGKPKIDVGEVLAAIPDALEVVNLLFPQYQKQHLERAAPVAGGQPGAVVGQFNRPTTPTPNIAQLLAAMPGIR